MCQGNNIDFVLRNKIDEHFKWNTPEELEGVLVSLEEVLGSLTEAKLHVTQAAVAKDHDKEGERISSGVWSACQMALGPSASRRWTNSNVLL